jgi:hypothetical protein
MSAKRPKKNKVTMRCHSEQNPVAGDDVSPATGESSQRNLTMPFSAATEALIASAVEKRNLAVDHRTHAKEDATVAAAATAQAKDSEAKRVSMYAEHAAAKTAALQALEKELSIPVETAPPAPPPAAPPPAAPKKK